MMRRAFAVGRFIGSASVLVLVFIATACSRSSPTEPIAASELATITFADGGALSAQQATIRALIEQAIDRAAQRLAVGVVNVTVTVDPGRSIPGWGMGGYAIGGTDIELVFDPSFPGFDGLLPARLPHLVAHEVHHLVRFRGVGAAFTLFEAMVLEGMADRFALELLNGPIPPWANAFPESETMFYLDRARPEFDDPNYDFNAWFFGIGTDLPAWTGYTLGYRLVRDYFARNPGSDAAQFVGFPASVFRPD